MSTLDSGAILAGRYRIVRPIGEGGMGAVYEALQIDLGRRVALKVLHSSYAANESAVLRFKQEALAAAALGHPNIVRVTDFVVNPGEPPFLVMELLESGQTLRDVLRAGPIDPQRAAYIGCQVLSALEAAHRSGLVHRDVKPDNVFLSSRGVVSDFVTLLDFGIAKMTDSEAPPTQDGHVKGTVAYMAPEQATNGRVGPWTDVYGVGATLYRALTGSRVFERENVVASLNALLHDTPAPVAALAPHVPSALSSIIMRALSKNPDARPASAAAMEAELTPFARGTTPKTDVAPSSALPTARAPSVPTEPPGERSATLVSSGNERPRTTSHVSTMVLLLGVGAFLAGVGGAAFVLSHHGTTTTPPTPTPPTSSVVQTTSAVPPPPPSQTAVVVAPSAVASATATARPPPPPPPPTATTTSTPTSTSTSAAPALSASASTTAACVDFHDCQTGEICAANHCSKCPLGTVPALFGPVCKKRCYVDTECPANFYCADMALAANTTLVCSACENGRHRPASETGCR